jgi:hypothetical protein
MACERLRTIVITATSKPRSARSPKPPQLPENASDLSQARIQEMVCMGGLLQPAFDKFV